MADSGTSVAICAPRGADSTLDATVELGPGDHVVTVNVVDAAGRTASAQAGALAATDPSAPSRPEAPPLRVTGQGDGLVLTWEDLPGRTASASRGTLASLRVARRYDHREVGTCAVAGGRVLLDPAQGPAGSYFLTAGRCDWGESAPGRDSFGRPRPLARCP